MIFMSTHSPNLWGVLSEASSIVNAHGRHFLALSLLFLLPTSIFSAVYPFLTQPSSVHSHFRRSLLFLTTPQPQNEAPPQILPLVLSFLFVLLFPLCGVASITYSTYRGYYSRPVKFISALKSILYSFLPLLATQLVTGIILAVIFFAFGILVLLAYTGLALMGFEMDYDSAYFAAFVVLMGALVVALTVYLEVHWCLSSSVVVVESKWGFASLKRSWDLVKGMRGVVFSMILLFGTVGGVLSGLYPYYVAHEGGFSWLLVVYVVLVTLLPLYGLAAGTVLFVYCKELHGDMVEGLGIMEYGRLPSFEVKAAAHVVYE